MDSLWGRSIHRMWDFLMSPRSIRVMILENMSKAWGLDLVLASQE